MNEIEEKKLLAILEDEKAFIDTINYSDEPIIKSIDSLNGYLLHSVPEDILKKIGSQIDKITLTQNSTNDVDEYQEPNKLITENIVIPHDINISELYTKQNPHKGKIQYSLAGHIQNQYSLYLDKELEEYVFYLCNRYFEKYPNFVFNIFKHNAINEGTSLNLKIYALWVNFMKKYEFNPVHSHSGRLSFVIWYKVPFTNEDEIRYGPCKRIDDNNHTGNFQFVYSSNDESGIGLTNIRVDKNYEGKILLFPSYLCHTLYPFYTSDEYRISIAGNVKYENSATPRFKFENGA